KFKTVQSYCQIAWDIISELMAVPVKNSIFFMIPRTGR
ncbi:unnamed protein product, partial [Adineta steineri]